MIKKRATKVIIVSVAVLATIGFRSWHKITFASSDNQGTSYLEEEFVSTENAILVVGQESGSNDVALSLEFSDEYSKSITSFELCMQLDQSEIENVDMKWNEKFKTNHCRYMYDQKTGELRVYVVDNKDLLDNTKIDIGNISIISDATSEFETSLVLEELKTIDLQHNSNSVIVDTTIHNVVYTPSAIPTGNPPTENPPIEIPTGNPPTETPTGNPPTENPATETPTGNPPTENPPIEIPTGNPPTENPPIEIPTGNPPTENPPIEIPTGNPPTEAPTNNPSTETPTNKPPTEAPTNNPSAEVPPNYPSVEVPPNNPSTEAPSSIVRVQDIKLSKTKETLEVGKAISLTAIVLPDNASNKSVIWSSDNEKVAKVSADGKVTAIGKGTANITVCTNDGTNIKKTVVITVKEKIVKATSIKLSKTTLALKPKASSTLKVTISPSEVTNKEVVWSSSNPKVATVKNGKITAKAVGSTTITVQTKDGSNKKATCKITVANIKLNKTKATLSKNKSLSLKATVSGKSKKVTWKSSNSKIATVSKTGKVTAKKAGTATITAKANGVTATFKVIVK